MARGRGQHGSNETLTEPNYVLQEYETTKSENGYSIVNIYAIYRSTAYESYIYVRDCGLNISIGTQREELQGEARPDGTSSKIGNSACDSMIVNAWSTPDLL